MNYISLRTWDPNSNPFEAFRQRHQYVYDGLNRRLQDQHPNINIKHYSVHQIRESWQTSWELCGDISSFDIDPPDPKSSKILRVGKIHFHLRITIMSLNKQLFPLHLCKHKILTKLFDRYAWFVQPGVKEKKNF